MHQILPLKKCTKIHILPRYSSQSSNLTLKISLGSSVVPEFERTRKRASGGADKPPFEPEISVTAVGNCCAALLLCALRTDGKRTPTPTIGSMTYGTAKREMINGWGWRRKSLKGFYNLWKDLSASNLSVLADLCRGASKHHLPKFLAHSSDFGHECKLVIDYAKECLLIRLGSKQRDLSKGASRSFTRLRECYLHAGPKVKSYSSNKFTKPGKLTLAGLCIILKDLKLNQCFLQSNVWARQQMVLEEAKKKSSEGNKKSQKSGKIPTGRRDARTAVSRFTVSPSPSPRAKNERVEFCVVAIGDHVLYVQNNWP